MILSGKETQPLNVVYHLLKKHFVNEKRIVDIGCGIGRHLKLMPEGNIGIDIDPPHELSSKYTLIKYDLNNSILPIKNKSVDIVFCSHVLEHLSSPYLCLKEFHRILSESGTLILGIPNPNCIYFDFYELSKKQYWDEHLYAWNMDQAKRFIINCGFSVDRVYSNFPCSSKLIGTIWNCLPILKNISADMWFVCTKKDEKIYRTPAKRYVFGKILTKIFKNKMTHGN